MNRIAIIGSAVAVAIIAANPSYGTDLAQPKPYYKAPVSVAPPFTWQGFYVGFNAGYGWGDSTFSNGTGSNTVHLDGALAGAGLGYNFQSANVVFGIEGEDDYSWLKDSSGPVLPCPSCQARNFYLATLRGRLGYAWDHWLAYVTGGAAFGDIQVSTPAGGSQFDDRIGWTAGGGVEYAFPGTRWSTKIEYLYADLGSMTCDAAHCGVAVNADFHANIVRAGLNYHFW